MWRAEVIEKHAIGLLTVKAPQLYGGSAIQRVQSAVDADPGARVILADLNPTAKTHDWLVVGFESMIGRWGEPYAHEHPIGDIEELPEILADKADVSALSGYVTDSELTTALSGYATDQDLSAKATAPGPWVNCTPSSYITKLTGHDIQVRTTPDGIDLRSGRWRYTDNVPRDAVIFTLPASHAPPVQTMFMTSGMSNGANDYTAINVHLETRTSGDVTARSSHVTSPTITLNQSLYF